MNVVAKKKVPGFIFHFVSVAQPTAGTCWITGWAGLFARLVGLKRYFLVLPRIEPLCSIL
jgi:hypothetical protein